MYPVIKIALRWQEADKAHKAEEWRLYLQALAYSASRRLRAMAMDDLDEVDVLEVPERLGKRGGFRGSNWELGAGQRLKGLASKSR